AFRHAQRQLRQRHGAPGLRRTFAAGPLFQDHGRVHARPRFGIRHGGVVDVPADLAQRGPQQRTGRRLAAQDVGQFELEGTAAFGQDRLRRLDEGDQHAAGPAVVAVDGAVRIGEMTGLEIAVAVDRQRKVARADGLALQDARPHRADGRPDLRPGRADVAAQRPVLLGAEDGDVGIVEELRVRVAPGEIHRQLAIEQRADGEFQAERPVRDGTDGRRLPGVAPHLQFHVARLSGGCVIRGRKIERPGHIVVVGGKPERLS
ncbi:conserved hypothetical protein, partial [Ricinus communis]